MVALRLRVGARRQDYRDWLHDVDREGVGGLWVPAYSAETKRLLWVLALRYPHPNGTDWGIAEVFDDPVSATFAQIARDKIAASGAAHSGWRETIAASTYNEMNIYRTPPFTEHSYNAAWWSAVDIAQLQMSEDGIELGIALGFL